MLKFIKKEEEGYRFCYLSVAEIYKYIYKPDKLKKHLTYADIQSYLDEHKIVADAIDEKGVSYYQAYEYNGKYFLIT
jgi:hypothetical protein